MIPSKTGTALALLLTTAAFPGLAADTAAPGFLSELPVTSAGEVAGMKAWNLEGDDSLWLLLPDGKTVVAGYVFDTEGNDIGSAAVGATPVDAWESAGVAKPEAPGATGGMSPLPAPAGASVTPASDPVLDSARQEAFAEIMAGMDEVLAKIPEAERRQQIAELVAAMDKASSPAEFQLLLVEWSERVGGKPMLNDEDRAALEKAAESAPADRPEAAAASAPVEELSFIPAVPMPTLSSPASAESAPIQATAENVSPEAALGAGAARQAKLIAKIKDDTLWFAVGQPEAPVVYMLADPMCPYCAKSVQNLRGDIENGKLQLRVILAPLISSRSPGAVAGIMSTDNPAEAFWKHELDFAHKGASDLKHVDFATLPAEVSASIRRNYDLIVDNSLPGVPFFAWEGANGPSFLSGTPEAGHFTNLLPSADN